VEVCRQLRRKSETLANVPGGSCSRRAARKSDKSGGLNVGADDYMTKRFPMVELNGPGARACCAAPKPSQAKGQLTFADIVMDLDGPPRQHATGRYNPPGPDRVSACFNI